jgi:osmotically-inducible protein OsmY
MTTSSIYKLVSTPDERILCDVMRQIVWQSDIDSRRIRIEVGQGAVHLRGSVETCMDKVESEKAAKAVYGVTAVINELEVSPDRTHADGEIAHDILSALRNSTAVLEEMPGVAVKDGVAILDGHCRWNFQKNCAERTALAIAGVKRVVNLINIDPASLAQPSYMQSMEMAAA